MVLATTFLQACGDECTRYSDFTCSEIEKATYNAYFYFPNDQEYYLGTVDGLSACQESAYGYAVSKNLSHSSGWSYICCMQAKGSECYEKHK
jgi:hypothetical protein